MCIVTRDQTTIKLLSRLKLAAHQEVTASPWSAIINNFNLLAIKKLSNHFIPLVSFYTPWKHEKTKGFLTFISGKWRNQWHEQQKTPSVSKKCVFTIRFKCKSFNISFIYILSPWYLEMKLAKFLCNFAVCFLVIIIHIRNFMRYFHNSFNLSSTSWKNPKVKVVRVVVIS